MKNSDIYRFLNNDAILNDIKNNKVRSTVLRNKRRLKEEKEILDQLMEPSPEFQEYDKKRLEINEKYSGGKMIGSGDRQIYDIPDSKKQDYDKELIVLKSAYKDAIEEHEAKQIRFAKTLKENISGEIKITMINESDCNDMTYAQQDLLDFMIAYSDEPLDSLNKDSQ